MKKPEYKQGRRYVSTNLGIAEIRITDGKDAWAVEIFFVNRSVWRGYTSTLEKAFEVAEKEFHKIVKTWL